MDDTQSIADDKQRAYPGDLERGEITLIKAGDFDEAGPHVQLLQDEVLFPSGRRASLVRVTRSPKACDGVVIAPITDQHEIVLVRQFRHAPRIRTWELPRGATEPGRTPSSTLHEELLQEIGYEPIDVPCSLGRIAPDSGTLHEMPYLFAVRVRPHPSQRASPDRNECILGHTAVSYARLWDLCVRGALNDAFTLAAVLRLSPHFASGRFEVDTRCLHRETAAAR